MPWALSHSVPFKLDNKTPLADQIRRALAVHQGEPHDPELAQTAIECAALLAPFLGEPGGDERFYATISGYDADTGGGVASVTVSVSSGTRHDEQPG